jgi:hypothetical protein
LFLNFEVTAQVTHKYRKLSQEQKRNETIEKNKDVVDVVGDVVVVSSRQ